MAAAAMASRLAAVAVYPLAFQTVASLALLPSLSSPVAMGHRFPLLIQGNRVGDYYNDHTKAIKGRA